MRAHDALAARALGGCHGWAVEKDYEFDGLRAGRNLLGLFEGRRQLIVYRAFFEPGVFGWPEHALPRLLPWGRPGRPPRPSERPRHQRLRMRSRAPQADIARLKAKMGWERPWYNPDRQLRRRLRRGRVARPHVLSATANRVLRTYFINARGDEAMGSTWSYLDATSARAPGDVGGLARGLSSDPDLQVVELARQLRRRRSARQEVGRGVGRRRGGVPEPTSEHEAMRQACSSGI